MPIGVYSAIRQDTAGDYVARSFSFLMLAVPTFSTGTMVMVLPSDLVGLVAGGEVRPVTESACRTSTR